MKKFIVEIGSADTEVTLSNPTRVVLVTSKDVYAAHKHAYMNECNPGEEVLKIKLAVDPNVEPAVLYTLKDGFKK